LDANSFFWNQCPAPLSASLFADSIRITFLRT
jgi:hypothetical protein